MNLKETVQHIYQAFGRGDVPAILEHISEDVEWEYGAHKGHDIPWLQPRRGRAGVGAFFAALGEHLEFKAFEANTIVAEDRLVLALANLTCVVKRTGKQLVEVDEVHIWRFDQHGKVVRFRHAADTHSHWLALSLDRR